MRRSGTPLFGFVPAQSYGVSVGPHISAACEQSREGVRECISGTRQERIGSLRERAGYLGSTGEPLMRSSRRPWNRIHGCFTRTAVAVVLACSLVACRGAESPNVPQPSAAPPATTTSSSGGGGNASTLASGTYLANSSLYPRVIRIQHGPASENGDLVASTNGRIYKSTDNGDTFTYLDTVPSISGSTEYCCGTLFEMPQTVGKLTVGTLLFAATYYVGASRAIEVYTSTDDGASWAYSSTAVSGGNSSHGLWEPEFSVADDGALVMFWSDETDPCCSQKIAQIRTFDGVDWQDETNTVASNIYADRPGMAVVTKLPSGTYFMSYELCGPAACAVYYRTSLDGWNYGNPADTGTKVETTSGQYFEHAPTNTWSPSVTSSNGALLLVGQMLYDGSGAVSSQNGREIFVNTSANGTGPWYPIAAPVQVPTAFNNYCPNYSSALLPSANGRSVLEFASDYNAQNQCVTYFAKEKWNELPVNGTTYVLKNEQAGLCLNDSGSGGQAGTVADLATCSGVSTQEWVTQALGGGYFTVMNVYSSFCLDDAGASTTAGNKVSMAVCNGSAEQSWQFLDLGNSVYAVMDKAGSGLVLDDTNGSTAPGTAVQVQDNDGLPREQWTLQ